MTVISETHSVNAPVNTPQAFFARETALPAAAPRFCFIERLEARAPSNDAWTIAANVLVEAHRQDPALIRNTYLPIE
jgi:hypothetical protein